MKENICPNCGTVTEEYIPPYMRKSTPPQPSERKFFVNGVIVSAMTIPYDDAFLKLLPANTKEIWFILLM